MSIDQDFLYILLALATTRPGEDKPTWTVGELDKRAVILRVWQLHKHRADIQERIITALDEYALKEQP